MKKSIEGLESFYSENNQQITNCLSRIIMERISGRWHAAITFVYIVLFIAMNKHSLGLSMKQKLKIEISFCCLVLVGNDLIILIINGTSCVVVNY